MAKDPAFLFYYQDFLVGTSFMSLEEVGAYIKLLCFLADKGSLTEDQILKKIPADIWKTIKPKFAGDSKGIYNKRLREEVVKRKAYSESRRNNRKTKKDMKNICKTYDKHMENENEDVNVNKDIVNNIYIRYAENVKMTQIEYDKLVHTNGKFYTEKAILALDNYKGSSGKKYKSDYRAILSWTMDKVKKEFPVAQHQDGQKEEKFNRSGIEKVASLMKDITL